MDILILGLIGSILVIFFITMGILAQSRKEKRALLEKQENRSIKKIHRWYYTITDNWPIIFYLTAAVTFLSLVVIGISLI